MKKNLHPRRTLRQMHRVLCLTLMVLSLTTMLIPFAAAADLDGGLSSRGTIGNITDTTSAIEVISDGDYLVSLKNDKTKGWNIGFASTQIDKATMIVDNLGNRELHEIFRVVNHGGGMISIHPLHALDLSLNALYGAACRYGSTVTLHNFEPGDLASYWMPIKNADGSFTLKNAASGYVINLSGNNYSIGSHLINYSNTGNKSNQAFWFMPVTSEQAKIQARLNQLMDGSYGNNTYKVGTTYTGPYSSQQCKGFARTVHSILFGYDIGSTKSKPNNYQININSSTTSLVGSLTELSKKSDSMVRNLFAAARIGDFIQVRRQHSGSHSMIFLSSDANGVRVYECNVAGRNGIRVATISWSQFRSSNAAVSVYTARDYRLH